MSSSAKSSDRSVNQQVTPAACLRHDNVEVIEFSTGEAKIRINKNNTKTYYNQTKYDLADNADNVWHMIVVHHEGKYQKAEILERLFAIADHNDCYIVAYRHCPREDYFLIRLCSQFIAKLFYQCLKVKMAGGGPFMYFSVKLNVADYKSDQIHHLSTFEKAFTERCNHYEMFEGVAKVLNLDKFAQSAEFAELIFTLKNKASLTLLCSTLTKHCDIFKMVNGIRLTNNQLSDLSPFAMVPTIDLSMIDLRDNMISDVTQLKYLKKMNLTELFIANNPIAQDDGLMAKIQEILPNIVKVDGVYARNVLPSLRHLGSGVNVIEVIFQGDTIQSAESLSPHLFRKYKASDMWHQVFINHNGKYGKTDLLQAIFNLLLSHEFYPCHYQIGDKCDSFFIRNCYEQMEFLYMEKLRVAIPYANDVFTLTYKMNVANFKKEQIDPPEQITKAIESSFNLADKCLNLERFSAKPELNHIELIMSAPRTISHILLKGARSFMTNIEKLILRDNGLQSAKGMHSLTWMKNLNSIDLSKNKIENLSDIEKFPKVGVITSVKLNDNPFCAKYKSPLEYINAVKKVFPDIKSLDGRNLSPDGCCVAQKNFLCSLDTYDLASQFIHHYFNVYDSNTRNTLSGLYSKNAIFSISSSFGGVTGKPTDSRLQPYQSKSRNVLRMTRANATKNTFYGPDDIKQLWREWPSTQHDFQSFTIDVTYNSPMIVVLTVSGIFKELASSSNVEDLLLGFTRTFVLKRVGDGAGFFGHSVQYSIINEMLFLHRPSVYQIKNSFQRADNMLMDTEDEQLSSEEKEGMVIMFQELTCLVPLWCIKCLDQSSWNFKNAIDLFTHLCDENKVPDCAFNFDANTAG